jgi:hypothetical protein
MTGRLAEPAAELTRIYGIFRGMHSLTEPNAALGPSAFP